MVLKPEMLRCEKQWNKMLKAAPFPLDHRGPTNTASPITK